LKKSQQESIQFPSDSNLKISVASLENSEKFPPKNIESIDETEYSEKNALDKSEKIEMQEKPEIRNTSNYQS
jgi:hypothetical protein